MHLIKIFYWNLKSVARLLSAAKGFYMEHYVCKTWRFHRYSMSQQITKNPKTLVGLITDKHFEHVLKKFC
jgi:hypothetical protein